MESLGDFVNRKNEEYEQVKGSETDEPKENDLESFLNQHNK